MLSPRGTAALIGPAVVVLGMTGLVIKHLPAGPLLWLEVAKLLFMVAFLLGAVLKNNPREFVTAAVISVLSDIALRIK